jgi:hypothetical protein
MACDDGKLSLTREEALKLHRQMWNDMQKNLGDCPKTADRMGYKREWCLEHGYNICNDCFLCEYNKQHNSDAKCCDCLIEWKYDTCYRNEYYYEAPISEILALPEREVSDV